MFCIHSQVFSSESVQVSCLQWISQLGCLAVGYNIGVWSLVSMTSLSPQYTSAVLEDNPAPVMGLTWQEPLDDPRHGSIFLPKIEIFQ